jgi:hypothetical protein
MRISEQLRSGERSTVGAEIANVLKKKYRNVKWDPTKEIGSADMGLLSVTFQESSNEPSCYLTFRVNQRIKAEGADVALRAITAIQKALNDL